MCVPWKDAVEFRPKPQFIWRILSNEKEDLCVNP